MFSRRKCLNTSRNRGCEDISFKILETKRYFCKNKYYVARVPKINIMLSVPKINIMLRSENKYYVAFRKFTAIQMLQLYTRKNRFEFCQLSS